MRISILLGALTLAPALAFAQDPPRLYAGAAAGLLTTFPFSNYSRTQVGPAGVVGVQLSPRWALQTGVQLFWDKSTYSYSYYSGSGSFTTSTSESRSTFLLVPLLARLTLTNPGQRLQVDLLGGGSWLHSQTRYSYSYGGVATRDNSSYSYNGAALQLGPQVRYRLGQALDLTASVPVLGELTGGGNFGDRLALAPQLGAQYVFGGR